MKTVSFPSAVIFDWDNTLVDSWGAIGEAINHTRAHFGQGPWTPAEVMANCTRAARDSFPEWFGDHWEEAIDVFYKRFTAVQMQNLRPLVGAEDLLKWLKAEGIPSFVVSNKKGPFLRKEAEALRWSDFFMAIAGSTDAARDKPAREHVDYALTQGKIAADASVWFVGDSRTDVDCARNAGCTPVLIGHDNIARQLGVELVFPDCASLQKLLYSRRNGKAP